MNNELRVKLIGRAIELYENNVIPYDDFDLENFPGNDYSVQEALNEAAEELNLEDDYDDLIEELINELGL